MHICIYCTIQCIKLFLYMCLTDPFIDFSEFYSMDLDNSQGKQLLRVLLKFAMLKHGPLSLHALKLIFRHFSQRDEMVKGFTEVRQNILGIIHMYKYIICIYMYMYMYTCTCTHVHVYVYYIMKRFFFALYV